MNDLYIQTVYLRSAIEIGERKKTVNKLVKFIKSLNLEFDAIAFRGVSGALIAPIVADKLGKGLVIVRKKKENSHSYQETEGYVRSEKYIIIDDIMDSGTTIKEIVKNLSSKCVGCFLYAPHNFRTYHCFPFPVYAVRDGKNYYQIESYCL